MADRYYRRGHWVNKPRRKSKKGAGWLMLAVAAGVAWFAVQGVKAEPSAPVQPASTAPIAPADAAPPEATTP
ncbi:hypothetical protein E1267_43605 [Nonomuraea longispora]|uniref:Uncharacterized protein n=1 Tax=Nonomuraea longispora TaxID=1848320 RepID=A0A4R4MED9_9ACTN|nr:hypothetical protein [Nonomuraea longispora]TDB93013.1 hypothetical protein E1267_43605 [Nonomuraea longispora]